MLPKGYKYICGSKGDNLSDNQKQRIAIARAIIRKPKILILDESMSTIEDRTQKEMRQVLNEMMPKRTSIVLSQKLSVLSQCDRVVKISKGCIVEDSEN